MVVMTWQGMCGSGRIAGMIRKKFLRFRVAVPGPFKPSSVAAPFAPGTVQTTGTIMLAFVAL